nr:hypothetical protein [Pseudomonas aeruginosa]
MAFEPPQKGNPHKLTVHQHTFPSASITRFMNANGAVQVLRKASKKPFYARPSDRIFCAQRVWDQQAESGYMKSIEDSFQELATAILDEPAIPLDSAHFALITEFYCLWSIRAQWKIKEQQPDPSIASNSRVLGLRHEYTLDEQEQLEASGISYIRPDLTIPGRQFAGPSIRLQLSSSARQMRDVNWELLLAGEGEFVVPDNFTSRYAVPLSPTTLLWGDGGFPSGRLDGRAVAGINGAAAATSVKYIFARDFSLCPF